MTKWHLHFWKALAYLKNMFPGVKMFHLFSKSIKCYFPTRILFCCSFVVIWILRKCCLSSLIAFIDYILKLRWMCLWQKYPSDSFTVVMQFSGFEFFQTIPLIFFFPKLFKIEALLLAATGVPFELGCLDFSLWMRSLWKEGQMILCICPVCGFGNIWCWLCWRQRSGGTGKGEEAFFWEHCFFFLF